MLTDLTVLSASLLTISGIVKVIVDLLKIYVPAVEQNSNIKYVAAAVLSILLALGSNISLFDTTNQVLHYVGAVGAGLLASLGSNLINDGVKVLQSVKDLKKPPQV